ncbi:MAG: hypothetical protein ACK40V_05785 [Anaerolineales bacterium]
MNSLFWNTITDDMREVLTGFMQSELGNHFYLTGLVHINTQQMFG